MLRGVLPAPDATPHAAGVPGGPSIQIRGTKTLPGRCRADGDEGSAKDSDYWVYVVGPIAGAGLAVVAAFVLRRPGGGRAGSGTAPGGLFTEAAHPDQA